MSEQTINQVKALCEIAIFFAIPFVVAHYTGSTFGFLVLAAQSVIGARLSNGDDNGGFGYLFIISMFAAFGTALLWLVSGVK